jgi:hypothetical protein
MRPHGQLNFAGGDRHPGLPAAGFHGQRLAAGPRRPWPLWCLLSILVLSGLPKLTHNPEVLGDARLALILAFTAALLLAPAHWTWPLRPGWQPRGLGAPRGVAVGTAAIAIVGASTAERSG